MDAQCGDLWQTKASFAGAVIDGKNVCVVMSIDYSRSMVVLYFLDGETLVYSFFGFKRAFVFLSRPEVL